MRFSCAGQKSPSLPPPLPPPLTPSSPPSSPSLPLFLSPSLPLFLSLPPTTNQPKNTTHNNTQQHTTTHNNTQQHTTTHNNTQQHTTTTHNNNTQQQHTTHNTQHTTHNTQHTTHNTQHTTHNTQHTTHSTQHTAHNTQHTTHNTQHTTHSTQHTTHNTQHTTHNTQHTTHNTQHTTHNTQHTTHNTQHTTHNTQHTTHNTQHTTTTTTTTKTKKKSKKTATTAQRTQAPPSEVVNKAVEAALQLVQDLQGNKLAVASKSVVIATTSLIAKQVVSSVARHDIHIQEASQARDLGLDVSSARKPTRRTMAKRWVKAGRRTRRCARFGRWASKQASARLWRTGAWAQKAYGTAAMGAPPSWVKQARTRAAEAAQCGGRARCLTTAIALLHPNADPAVHIPCNLIRQWLIFWEHNHRLRPYIGKVWAKIATAMMARSPAIRWRYVRGHMSAVIATLMQHNWVPI